MIVLAQDGIFPITRDKHGNLLHDLPASGLSIPGTIQGEGKLSGIPSLFVRVAGCNLHCAWTTETGEVSPCDTAYAAYSVKNTRSASVEDIFGIICQNTEHIRHIVITGGEPFLQAKELCELCKLLKDNNYHITIETNATIFERPLANYIDLFSLSPKLQSSVPEGCSCADNHNKLRISKESIQNFISLARKQGKDFQLKFVCASSRDIEEIQELLSGLHGWENEDILLMPLGGNANEMRSNIKKTLEYCIRNGWRYCDRLHISLFGAKQGV